jgi:hypothetical protein
MKRWGLFLLVGTLAPFVALGSDPVMFELHGPVSGSGAGHRFGASVALSETYVIVGNPEDDELSDAGGAVHVFDVRTGRRLRTLRPLDPEEGANFGESVAISGTLALIGAPFDDGDMGSVYLFDLSRGRQLLKIASTAAEVNSEFGRSVDLEGTLAAVGAPLDDSPRTPTVEADAGAVSFFRLDTVALTSTLIDRVTGSTTVAGNQFGTSVSLSNGIAAIGAPRFATQRGIVYLFDAETGDEIREVTASDGTAGDRFGTSVDLVKGILTVGAPTEVVSGDVSGAVYWIPVWPMNVGEIKYTYFQSETQNLDRFGQAVASDGWTFFVGKPGPVADPGDGVMVRPFNGSSELVNEGFYRGFYEDGSSYGSAVAYNGTSLAVGAPNLSAQPGYAAGVVYLWPALIQPWDVEWLRRDFRTGQQMPNAPETFFKSFTTFRSTGGNSSFAFSVLSGAGAPKGRNVAVVSSFQSEGLDTPFRLGDPAGGFTVNGIYNPVGVGQDFLGTQALLTGVGIGKSNDYAVLKQDGIAATVMVKEGDNLTTGGFTGQQLNTMGTLLGAETMNFAVVPVTLRSGTIPVTKAGDTGVMMLDYDTNALAASLIEGTASPLAGVDYGQVVLRSSIGGALSEVPVSLVGTGITTANNFAIMGVSGQSGVHFLRSQKGDLIGGGTISSYLGEASSKSRTIYRVALAGVSSGINEAIIGPGVFMPLAQEGVAHPDLPAGVTISRFLKYFSHIDGAAMLVQLRGTGVGRSNDVALIFSTGAGADFRILMREGDVAPDTGGARIGVIQQVDVDADRGDYAIIASLTGAPKGTNQALFRGVLDVPSPNEILRKPRLRFRKGVRMSEYGTTVAITGMSMDLPADGTGAGRRGLGGCISRGPTFLRLKLSDRTQMGVELQ